MKRIEVEKTINAPIAKVWKAVSIGEEISKWFIQADFKPEVGYAYTFKHEDTNIKGEVTETDEPNKLVYTWEVEGTGLNSTVEWHLEEDGDSTNVKIVHYGDSENTEMLTNMFKSFEEGWTDCLNNLDKHFM